MDNERRIDVACGGGCRREAVYGQDGMGPFSRALKRGLDVFLGSAGLLLASPAFLAAWLAVRLEDGGPAIYRQERVG